MGGGSGVGGGSGGGGILNISLFGGIEHAMRPNGVFFGLFLVIFDHFGKIGVLAILAICQSTNRFFDLEFDLSNQIYNLFLQICCHDKKFLSSGS